MDPIANGSERSSVSRRSGSVSESAEAWSSRLLLFVLALFLYLTVSGLFIYVAPFSAFAQYSVLLHTVAGLFFLAPYAVYQIRHLARVWNHPLWYLSVTGYTAGTALLVAIVSGVLVSIQALFAERVSPLWDFLHTVSGISASVLLVVHVVEAFLLRGRQVPAPAERPVRTAAARAGLVSTGATLVLLLGTAAAAFVYSGAPVRTALHEDYGFKYGPNPFAPSLARTSTGAAIHPAALAGSKYCGDAGCHEQIVHEWEPSAHRYASRSVFFQIVQKSMAENNGAESTRYCAGCHDPIALFSGAKNIYDADLSSPGADEGISCAACHSIVEVDVKGNASYVLSPPQRYLFEERSGAAERFIAGFLIRAYPRHHDDSYSRDLLKTPEFCGACHKQFIDEEINHVGWVQLQNQYDNWRKSRWHRASPENPEEADPRRTLACRECHMRLTASADPAAGDIQDYYRTAADGKHRNHRFIGANNWHPLLHDLPGAAEQVRLTEEWLRGETEVPEIADRWTTGPVISLDLVAPKAARPGEEVTVHAITASNKVGHGFPTGPLDIIQCWLELTATDAAGAVFYESGVVDARGFIQEGSFMFKAEGVDAAGNLIDRHNLWDMVGARFRRSLFPGQSDRAEYSFTCPSAAAKTAPLPPERSFRVPVPDGTAGEILVRARLRYRKVDQALINYLAPDAGLTAPIVDLNEAETRILVLEPEKAQ